MIEGRSHVYSGYSVPLIFDISRRNLLLWANGQLMVEKPKFEPFVLVEDPAGNLIINEYTKKDIRVRKIKFKDFVDYKMYVRSRSDLSDNRYFALSNVKLLYYALDPDIISRYQQSDPIRILTFDIEVLTQHGKFYKAGEVPIISISAKYNDQETRFFGKYDKNLKYPDLNIIRSFISYYKQVDPDIVSTYTDYDLIYLSGRMKRIGLDPTELHRKAGIVVKKKDILYTVGQRQETRIDIEGRIFFDVYQHVRKDPHLSGIKSRGLKSVGRFYGLLPIELGKRQMANTKDLINTEELKQYNISDVETTYALFHMYFNNVINIAEMMQVSIGDANKMVFKVSEIASLYLFRKLAKRNIFPLDTNYNRYKGFVQEDKTRYGNKFRLRFEGALVNIYKKGFIKPLYKYDFSSFYPNTAAIFNLSPETTKIVDKSPYTGNYKFWYETTSDGTKYLYLVIPDAKWNLDLTIRINMSIDGVLKQAFLDFYKLKQSIKNKIKKETNAIKKSRLQGMYNAAKVEINALYGTNGLIYSRFGDASVAIATTGLCRYISKRLIDEKLKDIVVEADSVTGDTPVFVKDLKGNIDIVPIEDLHNSNEKRAIYNGPYKILTRNGWKDIIYTKKHVTKKDIYRIKFSNGYVDATKDHSLFNANGQKVSPEKLNIGDRLEIYKNLNDIGITSEPIKVKSEKMFNDFLWNYQERIGNDVTVSNEEEFAWLLGMIVADGSVSEARVKTHYKNNKYIEKSVYRMNHNVSITGNNYELMVKVMNLCNKHFGEKFKTKFKLYDTMKSSATYRVEGGYNKKIVDYLKELLYTKDRKTKKVPTYILNIKNEDIIKAFIAGFWAGDGYKAIHNNIYEISTATKFKTMAAGIMYLLCKLGYKTRVGIRHNKLNITDIYLRFPYKGKQYYGINNKVQQKLLISSGKEVTVYDVSTTDGSFANSLGINALQNTDGYYVSKKIDMKDLHTYIKNIIEKEFKLKNYLLLEEDKFDSGYFYKMKNYILKTVEGKYKVYGSAFKSSSKCALFDKAFNKIVDYVFSHPNASQEDLIRFKMKLTDLSNYKWPEDFILSFKTSRYKEEYVSNTSQVFKLIQSYEEIYKEKVKPGNSLFYVVTKGPTYKLVDTLTEKDIFDRQYYINMLNKMFMVFNIPKSNMLRLF